MGFRALRELLERVFIFIQNGIFIFFENFSAKILKMEKITSNDKIKQKRRSEIISLLEGIDQKEFGLLSGVVDEIVDLEMKMSALKKMPFLSVHPKNPDRMKITPAARLYKECSQSYMNAIRILLSSLRKVESNAEEELLKRLEEF